MISRSSKANDLEKSLEKNNFYVPPLLLTNTYICVKLLHAFILFRITIAPFRSRNFSVLQTNGTTKGKLE